MYVALRHPCILDAECLVYQRNTGLCVASSSSPPSDAVEGKNKIKKKKLTTQSLLDACMTKARDWTERGEANANLRTGGGFSAAAVAKLLQFGHSIGKSLSMFTHLWSKMNMWEPNSDGNAFFVTE